MSSTRPRIPKIDKNLKRVQKPMLINVPKIPLEELNIAFNELIKKLPDIGNEPVLEEQSLKQCENLSLKEIQKVNRGSRKKIIEILGNTKDKSKQVIVNIGLILNDVRKLHNTILKTLKQINEDDVIKILQAYNDDNIKLTTEKSIKEDNDDNIELTTEKSIIEYMNKIITSIENVLPNSNNSLNTILGVINEQNKSIQQSIAQILNRLTERHNKLKDSCQAYLNKIKECEEIVNKREKRRQDAINQHKKKCQGILYQIEKINAITNRLQEKITSYENDIQQHETSIQDLQDEITIYENDIQQHKTSIKDLQDKITRNTRYIKQRFEPTIQVLKRELTDIGCISDSTVTEGGKPKKIYKNKKSPGRR